MPRPNYESKADFTKRIMEKHGFEPGKRNMKRNPSRASRPAGEIAFYRAGLLADMMHRHDHYCQAGGKYGPKSEERV